MNFTFVNFTYRFSLLNWCYYWCWIKTISWHLYFPGYSWDAVTQPCLETTASLMQISLHQLHQLCHYYGQPKENWTVYIYIYMDSAKILHSLFPCCIFFLTVTDWESVPPSPAANVAHETLWHCGRISVFLQQILAFIFCLYTTAFFIPPHNPRPTKPKAL